MALLQPKLSLKVAQRQILTPGLMQMVSVLALNKLELKELINTEIVENPVLEELEESVPLIDDVALKEAERDRSVEEIAAQAERDKARSVRRNRLWLLLSGLSRSWLPHAQRFRANRQAVLREFSFPAQHADRSPLLATGFAEPLAATCARLPSMWWATWMRMATCWPEMRNCWRGLSANTILLPRPLPGAASELLAEAVQLVQNLDPVGVATRSLRECLLVQIEAQRREFQLQLGRHRAARRPRRPTPCGRR